MGCTHNKEEVPDPVPTFNMVMLGLQGSGKTSILNQLKGDLQHEGNQQLGIDSFIINKECKIIVFEVAGKAYKTWHNYLTSCHIVLFVIDISDEQSKDRINQLLMQIDRELDEKAKIVIAFNKIDQIKNKLRKQQGQQNIFNYSFSYDQFSHETFTCKCSAQQNEGIIDVMKKIYSICKQFHQLIPQL